MRTAVNHASPATSRSPRRRLLWVAGLVSGLLTFSAVAGWMILANRPSGVQVTRGRLAAAREQWEAAAPNDYDLTVKVTGPRSATYRVQVRGGEATSATIDGRPVPQQRTFGVWSVPGMFATIEKDVEFMAEKKSGRRNPRSADLYLLGEFDPKYGYPRRYHRIEYGEYGSDMEVTWEVTEFRPLGPNEKSASGSP